jgi:hypothetical protein
VSEFDGDDPYANDDPASFNTWFPLEHQHLDTLPFKVYFCKLKSNSAEVQEMLMDPRNAMRGALETLAPIPGVDEETKVTTTLVRHDRTMRFRAVLFVATYDEQDNSLSLTSHKQLP